MAKKMDTCYCLSPIGFGLALAILWTLSVVFLGITAMVHGYGAGFVSGLSTLYIGFSATWMGLVKGALWAFFDAFFSGFVLIWLYNWLCCSCKCCGCLCAKK